MSAIALNARFYSHITTGMQRYALELANRFGDEVDSIRPSGPLVGMKGHLWEQLYLPSVVRGKLLWSPNNTGPLALANQVCTIHDLVPMDRPEWFDPRFSALYKWLMPRLARRVHHIVAVSNFTKERIVDLCDVPHEKITVVPNGIGDQFYRRSPEEIQEARGAAGIPEGRYIMAVGCLVPRKNLKRLVQAWESVLGEVPDDVELVLVGGGAGTICPGYTLGKLPSRVRLTGYVKDEYLPALYSGATIMLCPSLYEGFGLTPLEAMACETPVICSNVTALPEVVGNEAVMVDPTDVRAWAEAIRDLLYNDARRAELARRGPGRARLYSWDAAARETFKVLQAYSN